MPAAKLDLSIEQGADWTHRLIWKTTAGIPIDLTGYTARMQARATVRSSIVLLELTSTAGGIVLGDVAGTIDLIVTAVASAAWSWRQAVYDLELVAPGGTVTRLVEGHITVDPEVTR